MIRCSPDYGLFCLFKMCLFACFSRQSMSEYKYSRQEQLEIRDSKICDVLDFKTDTLEELGLLCQPVNNVQDSPVMPTPRKRHRKRCARTRNTGQRGGNRARLEANRTRPGIPSILLANVRSLDNRMDHIRLLRSANQTVRNCCVSIFTETSLPHNWSS